MRQIALMAVVAALTFTDVSCLKCFVGSGNSSTLLPDTEEAMNEHEVAQTEKTPFRIMTCGKAGSEMVSVEKLIRNVTDQIQNSLQGVAQQAGEAIKNIGSRRRRAAEDNDENYACVKILMKGQAHRSCVPKIGNIKLNCTSAIGQLALCYCHEDNCNAAPGMSGFGPITMLVVFFGAAMFRQ